MTTRSFTTAPTSRPRVGVVNGALRGSGTVAAALGPATGVAAQPTSVAAAAQVERNRAEWRSHDIVSLLWNIRIYYTRARAKHPGFKRRPGFTRARFVASLCALLPGLLGATSDRAATDAGLADFRAARFAEAFEAWQASAERGSAHGALYLGVLFDTGLGVNRDRAQAAAWYRRAAGLGSAAAAFNLGVLYDAGLLGPGNATDAAKWYGIAAAQHFPRAEYNLAMLYEAGEDGVKRSPALAIGLYQRAAAHGIAAARAHLTALGAPYAGGSAHVAADSGMDDFRRAQQILLARGAARTRQATGLLQSAAQQHNPPAEYDLGYCYQYGIGIAADRGQALVWYRRAAADARDATLRALAQTAAQGVVP